MSHYEERLASDLGDIRERVHDLGRHVLTASKNSIKSLLRGDVEGANAVILGDLEINRDVRALDQLTHSFVVRHLPAAGHLRLVSSVLRINVALERIGDYAVTTSREMLQLKSAPPEAVKRDIEMIAQQAWRMLDQALAAFHSEDAEAARATAGQATQINLTFQRVYDDLLSAGEQSIRSTNDLFALLAVVATLGRIGDLAKNICEETLFTVTGDTKEPKVYKVLFVDSANICVSQMAEAFARKAFPNSGSYASAGWSPAGGLDPEFVLFMDRHGLDVRNATPKPLDVDPAELAEYHVIVSLQGDARAHIPDVPYRSVLLSWNVPPCNAAPGELDGDDPFLEAYRQVSLKVRELMETLRGRHAD